MTIGISKHRGYPRVTNWIGVMIKDKVFDQVISRLLKRCESLPHVTNCLVQLPLRGKNHRFLRRDPNEECGIAQVPPLTSSEFQETWYCILTIGSSSLDVCFVALARDKIALLVTSPFCTNDVYINIYIYIYLIIYTSYPYDFPLSSSMPERNPWNYGRNMPLRRL